jgi:hypothetical protein
MAPKAVAEKQTFRAFVLEPEAPLLLQLLPHYWVHCHYLLLQEKVLSL